MIEAAYVSELADTAGLRIVPAAAPVSPTAPIEDDVEPPPDAPLSVRRAYVMRGG